MSKHKNNKSTYKGIRFGNEMVEAVEGRSNCFSKYVKQAVREKLERDGKK